VPDGVEVLSNGVMPRNPTQDILGWKRWSWRSLHPQATYLAFLAIGQYEITRDTTADGQQVINAYSELLPQDFEDAAKASVERTAEVVEWESGVFGPYPFEAQGGVVGPPGALGFALETQTRSVYSSGFFRSGANMSVVVHENAHQWFGDSISVEQWKEIWLNEGFASYAEWLWSEEQGEGTTQEIFDYLYATQPADFWTIEPGDPGAADIFSNPVYDRGAMTLHQLRLTIGDEDFFELLRTWAAEHKDGDANTAEFIALAEKISGQQLDELFQAWLYTPSKPAIEGVSALARKTAPQAPKSWAKIQQTHELLHAH
jgi:aminopeptidase N